MKKEIIREAFTPILHPYQATVITTMSKSGKPNAVAIAWIIPVSINPPALAFAIRKSRYSYKLLKENPEFVVNIPTANYKKAVTLIGTISGKDRNKIAEAGLETENAKTISPPVIANFPAHIECKVTKIVDLGLDHVIVIGEVLKAFAECELFKRHWKVNKVDLLLHLGGSMYTSNKKKILKT